MSRRGANNGQSDVRGPTSALTSFLREQGITVPNANRFQRSRDQQQPQPQPQAGPSNAPSTSGSPGPSTRPDSAGEGIQEEEDRDDGEFEQVAPTSSKRKRASTAAEKRKAKKAAELDAELADLGTDSPVAKGRYADRTPGSFVFCAECGVKFTFTKYTRALPDGGGVLCPPCQKEYDAANKGAGGGGGAQKKGAGRARAVKPKPAPLDKPKPMVKSLQTCCIELIGKNIDEVEDFGEVGMGNLDRICKIVCKNRGLNERTVKLFLDMTSESLSLYDCARLDEESYELITRFAPKLRSVTLNFCGTFKDPALQLFKERMHHLVRLELFGAFLVKAPQWISFFDSFLQEGRDPLEGFLLRQSPRFDNASILRLAENFPNLRELRLSEIQQLKDDSLQHLRGLKSLVYLDISRAGLLGNNLTDDGVVPLLEHVGSSLETLVLSENERLTDRTLYEGVRPHCPKLRHLGLRLLKGLEPGGVTGTFSDWSANSGLDTLDISRCLELDDACLAAILQHSGQRLVQLNMNSVDKVTEAGIKNIIGSTPELKKLDLGFVRAVDDFLLKDILENCPKLEYVSVFGCNRITDMAPVKTGVQVLGEGTCQYYRL